MSERQLPLAFDDPPSREEADKPVARKASSKPVEVVETAARDIPAPPPESPDTSAEAHATADLVEPAEVAEQVGSGDLVDANEALLEDDEGLVEDGQDTVPSTIYEPTLWRDLGWTAEVVRSEDGEGWAVAMTRDGDSEPALVGPWTMGRDKKNPKPMNTYDFRTLVKAANDVLSRHEQAMRAKLHRSVVVHGEEGRVKVTLDIVPDEEEPYALLAARDERGELLAEERVSAGFRLSEASAAKWVAGEFGEPR
jgi:hypothetical protein